MPDIRNGSPCAGRSSPALAILGVLGLALVLLPLFYVGFQSSDDRSYLLGALGWLDHFPYVGDSHWALRHTIALPAALSVALLGLNEFAVSLPSVLYYLGFLALNTYGVRRFVGPAASLISAGLLTTMPGFLVVATYLGADVAELFFVSAAFWALCLALESPQRLPPWLAAGALAAMAFLTRQTAAAFVLFMGVLFLVRPLAPRKRYLVAAAAFILVVGLEWLYLFSMTGNPVYRWSIDLHHDRIDRFAEAARVEARSGIVDKEGTLSSNVYLDPIVNLFVSQKYALLFWLALPALAWAWLRRQGDAAWRTLVLLACLGATSFLFVAWNPRLYLVPRYFMIVGWAATVLVGAWLAALWRESMRRTALALGGLALAANGAALAVENIDPCYIERTLVAFVREHPDATIHTDLETALRARFFFRFDGTSPDRVATTEPVPGSLFFYSPERVATCAQTPRCRDLVQMYRPRPTWRELPAPQPRPRAIARLIAGLGLVRFLPADIARKILTPHGTLRVYQVEQG